MRFDERVERHSGRPVVIEQCVVEVDKDWAHSDLSRHRRQLTYPSPRSLAGRAWPRKPLTMSQVARSS